MAEQDVIPLYQPNAGSWDTNTTDDITIQYHNTAPIKVDSDQWAVTARPIMGTATTTMSIDGSSRGRGIADFQGYDLMMVNDDTMYYSGGSTEIFSTQGFAKELLGSYTEYNQAGVQVLTLVNAGDTSEAGTNDGSIWYHTDAQFLGFRIVRPLRVPPPEEMQKYWTSAQKNE